MNKYIFFTIISFMFYSPHVFADQNQDLSKSCDTRYDVNNPPVITFLGDSLGDFVDVPSYGWFGWETYLSSVLPSWPSHNWRVQNFAFST